MASDLDYAKMIEIPLNTCEYQTKKRKTLFKKKKFISLINKKLSLNKTKNLKEEEASNNLSQTATDNAQTNNQKENCSLTTSEDKKLATKKAPEQTPNLPAIYVSKKEKIKNAIISAQVIAVFALVSAIILTNVFWENSGMNTLFKSVFSSQKVISDNRAPTDFSLYLPVKSEGVTLNNGVIEIEGEYSLYPVCDGKVSKVQKETNGSYTVTISHSDNFFSVIEGVDLVYFSVGEEVSRNLPMGYANKSAKVYLYEQDKLLTDYATVENSIVFNK
ncbi:MAG: hypothetical protein IKJ19_05615 [Clostridia bacterium]|nr:hypothetical protein [Clostridia bacterium]